MKYIYSYFELTLNIILFVHNIFYRIANVQLFYHEKNHHVKMYTYTIFPINRTIL